MNRHQALVFWGALFYVEYRWGLTLNRIFVVSFVLTASIAAYYLLSLVGSSLMLIKSSKMLSHPIAFYRRKSLIWVLVASAAFYGFYRTQIPGQLERYRAFIEREFEELTRKDEPPSDEHYNIGSDRNREKLVSETALEARKVDERRVDKKEIIKEIALGWNTATVDTENDNANWEKATDLLKKYPNYISNAHGHSIHAAQVLENPAEYYGEIVSFKGQAYSVEQLPPENSVTQFFGGTCYHAMLAVRDKKTPVIVSAYIIGNADIRENSSVKVKGFIYGQARLVNNAGGVINGLAFVGFRE